MNRFSKITCYFGLTACLSAPLAQAQHYVLSCKDIVLKDGLLELSCLADNGSFKHNTVNLNCLIANESGKLDWDDCGGYSFSCRDYWLDSFRYVGAKCKAPCYWPGSEACETTSKIDLTEKLYNLDGVIQIT